MLPARYHSLINLKTPSADIPDPASETASNVINHTEATGYGCVYYTNYMLEHKGDSIKRKHCAVSGSGNVAQYTVEKINQLGGKALTMSDSGGFIHDPDGINDEKLEFIKDLKNVRRGRISEYVDKYESATFQTGRPWSVPCHVAFPCATQNEINLDEANTLLKNGVQAVGEGANMPTELAGAHAFINARILYGPSKAANAGGVAVSGLEQSQNSLRLNWTHEEVEAKLRDIMKEIHDQCVTYGDEGGGHVDYVKGANIAGFVKVADAMLSYGVI